MITKFDLMTIFGAAGIDYGVAIESDAVRDAIAEAKTYPACMHDDALTLIQDAVAGEF